MPQPVCENVPVHHLPGPSDAVAHADQLPVTGQDHARPLAPAIIPHTSMEHMHGQTDRS